LARYRRFRIPYAGFWISVCCSGELCMPPSPVFPSDWKLKSVLMAGTSSGPDSYVIITSTCPRPVCNESTVSQPIFKLLFRCAVDVPALCALPVMLFGRLFRQQR
jgi:hypothetical protein